MRTCLLQHNTGTPEQIVMWWLVSTNLVKIWQPIICWLTCFVQVVNLKLFCKFCKSTQSYICNLYKTHKLSKNWSSNFGLTLFYSSLCLVIYYYNDKIYPCLVGIGLIEGTMDQTCILLAVTLFQSWGQIWDCIHHKGLSPPKSFIFRRPWKTIYIGFVQTAECISRQDYYL